MRNFAGVMKIVWFNWPWYASAAIGIPAAIGAVYFGSLPAPWATVVILACVLAGLWTLSSLAVSHYIYDRSCVARGAYLKSVDNAALRRAAVFHAGQDEVSTVAARLLPSVELQVYDFYDPDLNGTPSLKRARARNPDRAVPIKPDNFPLNDGVLDLVLIVFAAHEIRSELNRANFFREVSRVLKPTGQAIVVEHLRDGWNYLAYGLGAFHFLPAATWQRSFAEGGLKLCRENRCTPFVRVFELIKLV